MNALPLYRGEGLHLARALRSCCCAQNAGIYTLTLDPMNIHEGRRPVEGCRSVAVDLGGLVM